MSSERSEDRSERELPEKLTEAVRSEKGLRIGVEGS